MKIILVQFRAYGQDCREFFFNKTFKEIHSSLLEVCNTYVCVGIYEYNDYAFLSTDLLDSMPRPE